MRLLSLVTLAAVGAGILTAQSGKTSGGREAAIYNGPRVTANTYIWSDKYTYNPGQSVTIRRTIKTNGDLYPYTQVLYVVNNQTGAKTFLPGNNATVTDINGAALGSFGAATLTDGARQQIGTYTVPNSLGMHTIVYELRDYTGGRVLKSNYMKIGVVSGQETISGEITSSRTLTNDKEWLLSGIVFVKNNAVLTIEPGTFIKGQASPTSALVITRTGRIEAVGTPARPIVMTSNLPFGQRARADWGGLVMLGLAQTNTVGGTDFIEGLVTGPDSQFGGGATPNNAHNCGSLAYVRVEFAGSVLGEGNELNGITWGGCGTATVAHHLQSSFGEDDAFEWFGGTMHADHLIAFGQEDDQLDVQLGFSGSIDHFVGFQNVQNKGNRCIEADNHEDGNALEPFSTPTIFNVTCIGHGEVSSGEGNVAAAEWRRGLRGYWGNSVFFNFILAAYRISDTQTRTNATDGTFRANGILVWENGSGDNTLENNLGGANSFQNTFASGPNGLNIKLGNPLFASLEPSDPDFQGLFGSAMYQPVAVRAPGEPAIAPELNGAADYYGAVGPDDNWPKAEWTFYVRDQDMVAPQ